MLCPICWNDDDTNDWREPCCDRGSGRCEADPGDTGRLSSNCIHCGKELHEGAQPGCWFTWDAPSGLGNACCQAHDSHNCPQVGQRWDYDHGRLVWLNTADAFK